MKKDWEGVDSHYLNAINNFLSNNENINIPNPGLNHAKFIIYNLINSAKKSIKIFAANLSKDIYDDERILDAIKKSPVKKIEVLIEGNLNSKKFPKIEKVEVKQIKLNENLRKNIPGHFIVIDSKRFRFEQYINTNRLIDNTKGIVNFNNPEISTGMEGLFSRLQSS